MAQGVAQLQAWVGGVPPVPAEAEPQVWPEDERLLVDGRLLVDERLLEDELLDELAALAVARAWQLLVDEALDVVARRDGAERAAPPGEPAERDGFPVPGRARDAGRFEFPARARVSADAPPAMDEPLDAAVVAELASARALFAELA